MEYPSAVIFSRTLLSVLVVIAPLLWHFDAVLGSRRPFHYLQAEFKVTALTIWLPDNIKGRTRAKVIESMFNRGLITANKIDWLLSEQGYAALGLLHRENRLPPQHSIRLMQHK